MELNELPKSLLEILDPDGEKDLAVVVSTIDEAGYPHFSLLSTFEVFQVNQRLYATLHAGSLAAANLADRLQGALAFLERSGVYYLKFHASPALDREDTRVFRLELISLKIDRPAGEESGAALVSGLHFSESPSSRERRRERRKACVARLT